MTQLITLLLFIHFAIALQCYKYAQIKGYPVKTFTVLGLVPYFNVVFPAARKLSRPAQAATLIPPCYLAY